MMLIAFVCGAFLVGDDGAGSWCVEDKEDIEEVGSAAGMVVSLENSA